MLDWAHRRRVMQLARVQKDIGRAHLHSNQHGHDENLTPGPNLFTILLGLEILLPFTFHFAWAGFHKVSQFGVLRFSEHSCVFWLYWHRNRCSHCMCLSEKGVVFFLYPSKQFTMSSLSSATSWWLQQKFFFEVIQYEMISLVIITALSLLFLFCLSSFLSPGLIPLKKAEMWTVCLLFLQNRLCVRFFFILLQVINVGRCVGHCMETRVIDCINDLRR